jgi:hypothetical protein
MTEPGREHPRADEEREVAPRLPAWRWDVKDLSLRLRCPDCDGRVIASGRRLTCLIVGHRHYDEPIDPLISEVLRRLSG